MQEDSPLIYITNILPHGLVDPTDTHKTFLDLDLYRKYLIASFQELALYRVLDLLRPGPKDYEWRDY